MDTTYPLTVHDMPTSDEPTLLHDIDEEAVYELRAHAASGDYFIMLATRLDYLSQQLASTDPDTHEALERIIADLNYLHTHYHISRK